MTSQFDLKMNEIRERFVSRTEAREERLRQLLSELTGPDPAAAINELHSIAHSLSGTAGSFGFHALTAAADDVEREAASLRGAAKRDVTALSEFCNRLILAVRGLRQPLAKP